jgi:phosphoribosylformylglycinamidine synthase
VRSWDFGSCSQSTAESTLCKILGSPNVASKHWIIRQYDHEVQAGSVIKPLVGPQCDGPGDAAVVRPRLESMRGLTISCGMNPYYGDIDPYHMAASAMDEAVRNAIAVGADPSRIALLDNFCWGNTERPETLATLVRAALACHDLAIEWNTPFISGKDSLNNEFTWTDASGQKQCVAIPSSLLISAMGQVDDVRQCVTMDFKSAGNLVYLIGPTRNEMGGSHAALVLNAKGGDVPKVDPALALRIFKATHAAIKSGCVRACHDLSEGGLAVALAEMAFAGGLGVSVDISELCRQQFIDAGVALFSESNSRFLCEVPVAKSAEFEKQFADLPCLKLGEVTGNANVQVVGPNQEKLIDRTWQELKAIWLKPLDWA